MIFRLVLSPFRSWNSSLVNQNVQSRNFRRAAIQSTKTTSPTALVTTAIPGLQVFVTPGVNISPKRAPSAFNLFVMEKTKGSKAASGQLLKAVAPQWKQLSNQERQKYEAESVNLQKQYNDAFLQMSNDEFRRVVMEEMQRLQTKRVVALRRQQRQLKAAYEYPQAGPDFFKTAALAKDYHEEIDNDDGVVSRGKQIGQLWRNLSSKEKKAYEDREKTARVRYRKSIDAWEKKMKSQGLQNVVDTIKNRPVKILATKGRRRSSRKVLGSKVAAKKVGRKRGSKKGKKTSDEYEE